MDFSEISHGTIVLLCGAPNLSDSKFVLFAIKFCYVSFWLEILQENFDLISFLRKNLHFKSLKILNIKCINRAETDVLTDDFVY